VDESCSATTTTAVGVRQAPGNAGLVAMHLCLARDGDSPQISFCPGITEAHPLPFALPEVGKRDETSIHEASDDTPPILATLMRPDRTPIPGQGNDSHAELRQPRPNRLPT